MNLTISNKTVCCIIVTFNPAVELLDLVSKLSNQKLKLIIVDNNSNEDWFFKLSNFVSNNQIIFIKNAANLGIAKALNQGVICAKENGFNWVITFDQDTKVIDDLIYLYSNAFNLFENKKFIGAIGLKTSKKLESKKLGFFWDRRILEKEYLITSGTLYPINQFEQIGLFEETFFIDNVDLEYSLRIRANDRVLIKTLKAGMVHKPGNPIYKFFFGLRIESSNHLPFRRFYMARNNFILTKMYFLKFPIFILKMNFFFFLSLIKIIIVEENVKSKINASFKGFFNFYKFIRTRKNGK